MLSCFVEEYQEDMGALVGRNLKDFQGFHHRIADVIQNSIKPVLVGGERSFQEIMKSTNHSHILLVQAQRGVQKALLVTEDTIVSPSSDVDQLGILANLQAFLGFSTDIMGFVEEEGSSVVLDGPASRILLYRIQTSSLNTLIPSSSFILILISFDCGAIYQCRGFQVPVCVGGICPYSHSSVSPQL